VRYHLQMLKPEESVDPLFKEKIVHLEELINDSIQKCRSLSYELSPPVLHHNGLLAAIQWLVADMKQKYGLSTTLQFYIKSEVIPQTLAPILFRAIRELLFNIVKHSGTNSAAIQVDHLNSQIRFVVSDLGQGFDSSAPRTAAKVQGFGLFSLQERIRCLGGSVLINSNPGSGCCVQILVPESKQHPSPVPQAETESTSVLTPKRRSTDKARLLVVDDHAVVRDGLVNLLQNQKNLEIVGVASNGHEAVRLAAELAPDIILMDVTMPEMDGIEATSKVHENQPQIRIIGLSMHDDDETRQRMLNAGAVDYIYKAARADVLFEAIRKSLTI